MLSWPTNIVNLEAGLQFEKAKCASLKAELPRIQDDEAQFARLQEKNATLRSVPEINETASEPTDIPSPVIGQAKVDSSISMNRRQITHYHASQVAYLWSSSTAV